MSAQSPNANICLPPGFQPALTFTDSQEKDHTIYADEVGSQWLFEVIRGAKASASFFDQLEGLIQAASFFKEPTPSQQTEMNHILESILTLCSTLQEPSK